MNHAKLTAAMEWACSLQRRAPVSPHHSRAVAELWPWLEPLGVRTALEVGCGDPPGLVVSMLRGHGVEAIGLDQRPGCDAQGDMHDLPFEDDTFDLVVARHSLEHVLIPYLALMEMRRVSRRYLLVVVPWLSDKAIDWPDHFYIMPQRMWERIFRLVGLHALRFEEGDHTEQLALDQGLWEDREYRYLLAKGQEVKA